MLVQLSVLCPACVRHPVLPFRLLNHSSMQLEEGNADKVGAAVCQGLRSS